MPVLRYFLFVGGALLALLFAVDAFAPPAPAVVAAANASVTVDNPTLRIRSDRKWPEKIVFDTSLPTIVPPAPTVVAQASLPAVAATSEFTAKARVRESFAQFRPTDDEQKPVAKPQAKRKIAKHRSAPAPQIALVAQQQRFGFFASNTW